MLAVDLPLSAIGDTLFLPWDVKASIGWWRGPRTPANNHSPTNVADVQKQLNREAPIGSPRLKVEEWVKNQKIEYSFSQDFSHDSILDENQIKPAEYNGFLVGIMRDIDRGPLVTGNIQIYFLFDKNEMVAKHIVRWVGIGP
jgi:hypothetical protein